MRVVTEANANVLAIAALVVLPGLLVADTHNFALGCTVVVVGGEGRAAPKLNTVSPAAE